MKIVILDGYTENPGDLSWSGLEALGEVTIYERTPAELTLSRMQGADIVFTNKTVITRAHIEACPQCKYIGVLATGYNVVDLQAASERKIPVCNVPAYSTATVAQFTMGLLLEMCHHIGEHSAAVHTGAWTNSPDFCFWNYPMVELAGKIFGIIGYGKIGEAVAKLAAAFGMQVLVYSRHGKPGEQVGEHITAASLEDIFTKSDVISLHCPLTDENRGLICAENIAKMKDGVMLINTARGPLVNEQDLKDALESGKVAYAAVDVAEKEPIPADSALLTAKNLIITPHIAWAAREARQRLMDITIENLEAFMNGTPIHVVNQID